MRHDFLYALVLSGTPSDLSPKLCYGTAMNFAGLGVEEPWIRALTERGVRRPTEIQNRIIPALSGGKNVMFSSATGTGKTFAYLLPFFQRMTGEEGPPVFLVLAPTYELCVQIRDEADFLLQHCNEGGQPPFRSALLIGQVNLSRQIDVLKAEKPRLLVGNPGRVLLLARMGKLPLRSIGALVLDEGDRLAADELFGETSELLDLVRKARRDAPLQIAVCSATLPPKSRERLLPFMEDPVIETDGNDPLREKLFHWAIFSERREKTETLRSFLAAAKPRKALVFTSQGGEAGIIAARLQHHHYAAGALHGKMDKQGRRQALEGFRRGSLKVLVTSDLASRGLDIGGVSHVIALDVPDDAGTYLHRAGRTARAGNKGIMASIGDAEEMRTLARLEKKLGIIIYPKELAGGRILAPDIEG